VHLGVYDYQKKTQLIEALKSSDAAAAWVLKLSEETVLQRR
jgi:hypothetical protein